MDRKERLKRIEELQQKKKEREYLEFLNKIEGFVIEDLEPLNEHVISLHIPRTIYARIDAIPSSTISKTETDENLIKWITKYYNEAEIKKECYLSISPFGRWIKVRFNNGVNTFFKLWNSLINKNLVILTLKNKILCTDDIEYDYQIFIDDLESIKEKYSKLNLKK